ncbi:Hpt domain-containing protein [Paraneptunicella aestuarii]|uniref:Hpt domain-containing protein n=1 Tax=Paraneptunicella aestuarii TaxID=2831148 RepID=UPI001E5387D0|nr:Hpt domain-containing protein [Paraneptunicella aestuarii]UAA37527.1 Hpt domain-containing protein [Paraneptunicella aestuarii]
MTDDNSLLNLEFGLSQLSGNRDLLFKMFDRFAQDYSSISDELSGLITNGNYTEIRHKVHTIKGVSGNLGLNALYNVSKVFEDAAKASDPDIIRFLEPFSTTLKDTLQAIENAKNGGNSDSGNNNAGNDEGIAELKRLLEQNEFISANTLSELLAKTRLDSGKKDKISQAINDLDYPTALSLL